MKPPSINPWNKDNNDPPINDPVFIACENNAMIVITITPPAPIKLRVVASSGFLKLISIVARAAIVVIDNSISVAITILP